MGGADRSGRWVIVQLQGHDGHEVAPIVAAIDHLPTEPGVEARLVFGVEIEAAKSQGARFLYNALYQGRADAMTALLRYDIDIGEPGGEPVLVGHIIGDEGRAADWLPVQQRHKAGGELSAAMLAQACDALL